MFTTLHNFPSHIAVMLVFLLASCSGGGVFHSKEDIGAAVSPVAASPDNPRGFSLAVDFASESRGELNLGLRVEPIGGQVLVSVVTTTDSELSLLAFELSYDAARYSPLLAQPTDVLAPRAESLVLIVQPEPGQVSFGQVLLGDAVGTAGAGQVVAEVLFAGEPLAKARPRAAASVPCDCAAVCPLLWDEDTGELKWYYVNPGDYDQNGGVGVGDLTPLGRNYGLSGPFDYTSALSVVDGNGDGWIVASDLAEIGRNWGNRVEGYNLYASSEIGAIPLSYAEPSTLEPLAMLPLAEAQGDPAQERLWFSYLAEDGGPDTLYWTRPQAGGAEGTRSNVSGPSLAMPPPTEPGGPDFNLPPRAQLSLEYTGSSVPLAVTFDASSSSDADGTIIYYEWDFEGDGLFDSFSGEALVQHTYVQAGTYAPLVRVTDDGGAWDLLQSPPFSVDPAGVSNIAPLADVFATVFSGEAPLLVGFLATGSQDLDGYIARYEWDFDGDGSYDLDSGTDPTVLHTYTLPGVYDVVLRVTDDALETATAGVRIEVTAPDVNTPPTADVQAEPTSGDAPLIVEFDASGSTDNDGSIVEYAWDWDGDGQYDAITDTPLTSHAYVSAASPAVKLRVEDDDGARAMDTVTITVNVVGNDPPLAALTATPDGGLTPLIVTLDASGSSDPDGSIVSYEWDFDGDGLYDGYGGDSSASHTYASAGIFDARVRVTDDHGAQDTALAAVTVNVPGNDPPIADLLPATSSGHIPHTVNFDAGGSSDPDGSIVKYEWDFDGDGNYDGYGADATIDHTYTAAGAYTARLRVTDDAGAQDTDTASIDVNAPPVADLSVTPANAQKNEPFLFSALGSTDSDGTITDYEWDFDTDGVFGETDDDEDDYQGDGTVQLHWGTPGRYSVSVRVTDDDGAQDTASTTVTVHGWVIITVDSAGDLVSTYGTSLAVVGGCPAISYCDVGNQDLKYARATTSTGANPSDWVKLVVDSSNYSGKYSSLAVVDGCPAISYRKYWVGGQLKYARAATPTGASPTDWTQLLTVDTGTEIWGSSLAVVEGCPAISYTDAVSQVKYARATTSTGGNAGDWTQIVSVDSAAGQEWAGTSLAVVDGHPAISYYVWDHLMTVYVKYARSTTSTGGGASDWTQMVTLDGIDNSLEIPFHSTSLVMVDGCPALSYYDDKYAELKYARATTATGAGASDWTQKLSVDSSGDVGRFASLAVVDGCPTISYFNNTSSDLKYARATSSTGGSASDWTQIATVDSTGLIGYSTSLAEVDGCPAISYGSWSSFDLKYAIYF